jgi:glutaredoxin
MSQPPRPTSVTVVRTTACHFCEDALEALTELGQEFPLAVELLDAGEPSGVALLRRHRAAMFPLVLVDGRYFSVGRLPRRKLRALLVAQDAAPAGMA